MVNRKVTHLSDMRSLYLYHQCIGPVDDVVYYVEEYAVVKGESSVKFPLHFGGVPNA